MPAVIDAYTWGPRHKYMLVMYMPKECATLWRAWNGKQTLSFRQLRHMLQEHGERALRVVNQRMGTQYELAAITVKLYHSEIYRADFSLTRHKRVVFLKLANGPRT